MRGACSRRVRRAGPLPWMRRGRPARCSAYGERAHVRERRNAFGQLAPVGWLIAVMLPPHGCGRRPRTARRSGDRSGRRLHVEDDLELEKVRTAGHRVALLPGMGGSGVAVAPLLEGGLVLPVRHHEIPVVPGNRAQQLEPEESGDWSTEPARAAKRFSSSWPACGGTWMALIFTTAMQPPYGACETRRSARVMPKPGKTCSSIRHSVWHHPLAARPAARAGYRTRVLRVGPRRDALIGTRLRETRWRFNSFSSVPGRWGHGGRDLEVGSVKTTSRAPSRSAPPAGNTRSVPKSGTPNTTR